MRGKHHCHLYPTLLPCHNRVRHPCCWLCCMSAASCHLQCSPTTCSEHQPPQTSTSTASIHKQPQSAHKRPHASTKRPHASTKRPHASTGIHTHPHTSRPPSTKRPQAQRLIMPGTTPPHPSQAQRLAVIQARQAVRSQRRSRTSTQLGAQHLIGRQLSLLPNVS